MSGTAPGGGSAPGGGGARNPNSQYISVTPQEREAIDRVKEDFFFHKFYMESQFLGF